MQDDPPPATSSRRLTLPPRRRGLRQRVGTVLGLLMFAGVLVAMVVYTGPALVSDWQVRGAAQPAPEAQIIQGSCSTKLIITICDATLRNRTASGTVERSVNYVFTDVHTGDYQVEVMADPARPELVTSDLGLDMLWNRTVTFAVGLVVLLGIVVLPVVALVRNSRARAAATAG